MKLLPSSLILLALLALPALARADVRPDFEDDAKPLLRKQPDLLKYVHKHFEVQETGYARVPGGDDHAPPPPYIFRARPRGSDGPYTITLFIQDGPPGHILLVKNTGPVAGEPEPGQPGPVASQPPAPAESAPAAEPSGPVNEPAPTTPVASGTTAPTPSFQGVSAATPSGPIGASSPSLSPPADPAPSSH